MNQHQLNQDELLRISRAISDTTRYALLEKIYFDQQITVDELCGESTVSGIVKSTSAHLSRTEADSVLKTTHVTRAQGSSLGKLKGETTLTTTENSKEELWQLQKWE
jgi:hypothetical protein